MRGAKGIFFTARGTFGAVRFFVTDASCIQNNSQYKYVVLNRIDPWASYNTASPFVLWIFFHLENRSPLLRLPLPLPLPPCSLVNCLAISLTHWPYDELGWIRCGGHELSEDGSWGEGKGGRHNCKRGAGLGSGRASTGQRIATA